MVEQELTDARNLSTRSCRHRALGDLWLDSPFAAVLALDHHGAGGAASKSLNIGVARPGRPRQRHPRLLLGCADFDRWAALLGDQAQQHRLSRHRSILLPALRQYLDAGAHMAGVIHDLQPAPPKNLVACRRRRCTMVL